MAITATYVSASSFTVVGDQAAEFSEGRRLKCNCVADGYKFGTIKSSVYTSLTTITLTSPSDDLTSNLTEVLYGIQGPGTDGSVPVHNHGEGEGAGGNVQDNILINQDFSIWQENTTFTNPATGVYTADGYLISSAAGGGTLPTVNVKENTSVYDTAFGQSLELEITNVGASGAGRAWYLFQKVEDYKKYRGKTLTFSLKIKASVAITLPLGKMTLYDGATSTDATITSITTDWVTYSVTATIGAGATTLEVYYVLVGGVGSISTTGSIYIQWMKLELGSVNTPLIPRRAGEDLRLCQRYYQKSYTQGTFAGDSGGYITQGIKITDVASSTYTMDHYTAFPVVMKAAPTVTIYDNAGNSGRVTMGSGNNIIGTVGGISDAGFNVSAVDTSAGTQRKILYHYIATSRV